MTVPVLAERRRAREAMIERAGAYCADLDGREGIDVHRGVVVGSVARGDFNKWSDIDVLVIASGLPDEVKARSTLSVDERFPGVQGVLWSEAELERRRERGDPLAREADDVGVVVWGS